MYSIMQGVKRMQTLQTNINALLVVLNAFPDYKANRDLLEIFTSSTSIYW